MSRPAQPICRQSPPALSAAATTARMTDGPVDNASAGARSVSPIMTPRSGDSQRGTTSTATVRMKATSSTGVNQARNCPSSIARSIALTSNGAPAEAPASAGYA